MVQLLLRYRASPDSVQSTYGTSIYPSVPALAMAVEGAHANTTRALLKDAKVDVNAQYTVGSFFGHKGVGLNPEARNGKGITLIGTAAMIGRIDVVSVLLEHKADVNLPNATDGKTPLHRALSGIIDYFYVGNKSDYFGGKNKRGYTNPFTERKDDIEATVKLLVEAGANLDAKSDEGATPRTLLAKIRQLDAAYAERLSTIFAAGPKRAAAADNEARAGKQAPAAAGDDPLERITPQEHEELDRVLAKPLLSATPASGQTPPTASPAAAATARDADETERLLADALRATTMEGTADLSTDIEVARKALEAAEASKRDRTKRSKTNNLPLKDRWGLWFLLAFTSLAVGFVAAPFTGGASLLLCAPFTQLFLSAFFNSSKPYHYYSSKGKFAIAALVILAMVGVAAFMMVGGGIPLAALSAFTIEFASVAPQAAVLSGASLFACWGAHYLGKVPDTMALIVIGAIAAGIGIWIGVVSGIIPALVAATVVLGIFMTINRCFGKSPPAPAQSDSFAPDAEERQIGEDADAERVTRLTVQRGQQFATGILPEHAGGTTPTRATSDKPVVDPDSTFVSAHSTLP